ncbi:hypothetical protein [Halobellus salinisoli]|uniref:capsular polysaccharide export protein, LipB/KpsS family n=1 Tax=Halobellus salinisoli TaxID=3108500 RepID=UPI00300B7D5B
MSTPPSRSAIYAVTPHKNWVLAAEKLKKECGIRPTYWECPTDLKSNIEKSFPETIAHKSVNATKGVPPRDLNLDSPFEYPIDSSLIEDLASGQLLALKMMDRIDLGNVIQSESFGYNERVRHYYRLLSYWSNIFDYLRPDIAIFGSTPHLVSDYILYLVAERNGVETIIFTPTSLPDTFYLRSSIFDSTDFSASEGITDQSIPNDIQSYLNKLEMDYSVSKPSYMRNTTTDTGVKSVIESFRNHLIPSSKKRLKELVFSRDFLRWKVPVDMKFGSNKIENSAILWTQWMYYLIKSRYYLKKLRNDYEKKVASVSLEEDYIYFPLHYQPERTTSPEGNHYVDQTLAIKLLSNCADDKLIYIKEHPSQFDPQLKGQLGRTSWEYDDLYSHDSVRFIPLDANAYTLIDNADAVATITGTAGWEAINRGTAALVFGSPWYRDAPNVYDVETYEDIEQALELIGKPTTTDPKTLEEFVKSILSIGYRGKLTKATTPRTNQAETIHTAIKNWIDTEIS